MLRRGEGGVGFVVERSTNLTKPMRCEVMPRSIIEPSTMSSTATPMAIVDELEVRRPRVHDRRDRPDDEEGSASQGPPANR